jgi:hypothetical protein
MSKEEGRKTPADYTTPHDLAIRAANWAMKENAECAAAHRRWLAAKRDLKLASRDEIPEARAAYEAAKAAWDRITMEVFDRVMAEAGFGEAQAKEAAAAQ